jgi:hypothetical protein
VNKQGESEIDFVLMANSVLHGSGHVTCVEEWIEAHGNQDGCSGAKHIRSAMSIVAQHFHDWPKKLM